MPDDGFKRTETTKLKSTDKASKDHDPVVLAYRIDRLTGVGTLVRVRKSAFATDPNLIPWSKEVGGKSHGPDTKIATWTGHKRIRPNRRVAKAIQKMRFADEVQKIIREKNYTPNSLAFIKNERWMIEAFGEVFSDAVINRDLKATGLYKDACDEMPLSAAFPENRNDSVSDSVSSWEFDQGTFLEDSDITLDDKTRDYSEGSSVLSFPNLSTASFFELMRPPPPSLEHKMARRLADGHFFENDDDNCELFPTTLLFSRSVDDPDHFIDIMIGGLFRHFPNYKFSDYERDRTPTKRLVQKHIKKFFAGHIHIQKLLRTRNDLHLSDALDIWGRFRRVWHALTAKQRHALEKLYMQENPSTYEEAAKDFDITVDSLQDRVRSAVAKFRKEFSEFKDLKPRPRMAADHSDLQLNGMWRISEARKVYPLVTYDLETGEQKILALPKTKPRKRKLSPKEIAEIKAMVYETTPVPNILDAEYFDGLRPGSITREESVD